MNDLTTVSNEKHIEVPDSIKRGMKRNQESIQQVQDREDFEKRFLYAAGWSNITHPNIRSAIKQFFEWTKAANPSGEMGYPQPKYRVWFVAKGNKRRSVDFTEQCYQRIKWLWKNIIGSEPTDSDRMFPRIPNRYCSMNRERKNKVNDQDIREELKVLEADLNENRVLDRTIKNLAPHVLRHSYAHFLRYELGRPLDEVSELLGHADIETTRICTHIKPDIRDAWKEMLPEWDRKQEFTEKS